MKRGNTTTQELILQAGKQEFLSKGYSNASLRQIAKYAGVTTGAIYGYYPDKEALFNALVEEPAQELLRLFLNAQKQFDAMPTEEKMAKMVDYTANSQNVLMEYVYDHIEEFRLIVRFSQGTKYMGYIDQLVEIEEHYMRRFFEAMRELGKEIPPISSDMVHMLCSSCFNGMFEIVAHNIPREEGLKNIAVFSTFYRSGWVTVLGL